jgi:Zn-finger nucleic acid-binding protein
MATFVAQTTQIHCPQCGRDAEAMTRYGLAPTKSMPSGHEIDGCRSCGGVWLDAKTLKVMLEEAAELVGRVAIEETHVRRRTVAEASAPIRYRKCPVCAGMMGRKNFERVSGIILDNCIDHGTFFDSGELHDVLNFVRSGGLILAQKKRAVEEARMAVDEANARKAPTTNQGPTGLEAQGAFTIGMVESPGIMSRGIGELTIAVVRWGAGWAWRAGKAISESRDDG